SKPLPFNDSGSPPSSSSESRFYLPDAMIKQYSGNFEELYRNWLSNSMQPLQTYSIDRPTYDLIIENVLHIEIDSLTYDRDAYA
ncbi:hypothetical protein ACPV5V_31340, partial [Vibrio campbellii]